MSGRTALPGASAPAPAWRAALALAGLPFASDLDRNIRLVAGEVVMILAAVLCLIWAMWFGQFSRRTRVLTLTVLAVTVIWRLVPS